MSRSFRLLLALLLSAVFAPVAFAQNSAVSLPRDAFAYFSRLRDAYAKAQPGIVSWVADDERQKLLGLYDEQAPDQFISAASRWLGKCPVDAKVHLMLASLLAQKGRFEESIRHRSMFYGLLASIVDSGDGKTSDTGFKVISVDEEYTVLNHIDAQLKSQRVEGHCDAMRVVIGDVSTTIYFDISEHIKALKRSLPANPPQ